MSDPNRATLITVGAPKSAKANVIKTVRLTINLDESNESKYPELNYKELVFVEESKRKQNGKTAGLDPFSDNDDDVERVARKFEQKYGGKSTYGRKKVRSKQDDFADIGAGYDENDSFIDNTHGYDEMIPPECDTLYGGFYINSGSLEFKTVQQEQSVNSDEPSNRRNKRRISSSSSSESSSASCSESESADEKGAELPNGALHDQRGEKKNKKVDKKKAKKVRRTDSSAATSGKQTSDENNPGDAESVECGDSRTSDSLTSKPAPSSENPATSDSSRDVESKAEQSLPGAVCAALDALQAQAARGAREGPAPRHLLAAGEPLLLRLDAALKQCACGRAARRSAWARAAAALGVSRAALAHARKRLQAGGVAAAEPATTPTSTASQPAPVSATTATTTTTITTTTSTNNKRKHDEDDIDVSKLTDEQREAMIVETLQRLKALIDERKPSMLASYNAECERVQEERKKLQLAHGAERGPHVEKRLPKRRFPWCGAARALLARLTRLAAGPQHAAALLATRALPLFPNGFVRMPTLLRQADLSKEIKISDVKRQRLSSASQPPTTNTQNIGHQPTNPLTTATTITNVPFCEPIQFPSSLTVTTTMKTSPDKIVDDEKHKSNSIFGTITNTFTISKDFASFEKEDKKEELYIPPNNIGSITITPVLNQQKEKEKKSNVDKQPMTTSGLIRVKSPAALNDMVNKKDVKLIKKQEKQPSKDKRIDIPLHIDTSYQPNKKDPSPKDSIHQKKDPSPKDGSLKKDVSPKETASKNNDGVTQKQIETMRVAENNIPRPALVPVHHSPTFAKPDRRPPEGKKKKDVIVVSDVDPLSDAEPVNIDDSSSDVEVIETDKSDSLVPSDKKSVKIVPKVREGKDEATDDIDTLMRNIREMEHSQEPTKLNSNSYGGVITSAQNELL